MSYHSSRGLGAVSIEDTGAAPYKVSGDPVIALIAQLNRFAGRTVKLEGGCRDMAFLPAGPLPLVPVLNDKSATTAVVVLVQRYSCVPSDVFSKTKATWANAGLASDSVSFVRANLAEITVTIAQFADGLGLPPAAVGITTVDPKQQPASSFPTGTLVILGVLALGALVISKRMQ